MVYIRSKHVAPKTDIRELPVALDAHQPGVLQLSQMVGYRGGSQAQPVAHTRTGRRLLRRRDSLQYFKSLGIRKGLADRGKLVGVELQFTRAHLTLIVPPGISSSIMEIRATMPGAARVWIKWNLPVNSEHSVSSHLHLNTAEYDQAIRRLIPYYDESRGVQLDLLAAAKMSAVARVVDLGGGTGSLAEVILESFPRTSVLVRDIDRHMLEAARARLFRFGSRVELEFGSFADPIPPSNAVLAAFALHHIPNLKEKSEVYRRIREALLPGGVFLNTDAVSGPFWTRLRDEWAVFMAGQGFSLDQAYQNLNDWAAEDTYFSVGEEIRAMEQAGFERPECFWRRGPIAILGARN